MLPLTYGLMYATYPLTKPTAMMLDCMMGKHGKTRVTTNNLKQIVNLHPHEIMEHRHGDDGGKNYGLSEEQQTIIKGAFERTEMEIGKIAIKPKNVFVISSHDAVDSKLIGKICDKRFSRVPVAWKGNKSLILGVLRPENFLTLEPSSKLVKDYLKSGGLILQTVDYDLSTKELGNISESITL
jgi:CBS domain containing-hemolysin-like protein